jgi:hypothetical protein
MEKSFGKHFNKTKKEETQATFFSPWEKRKRTVKVHSDEKQLETS